LFEKISSGPKMKPFNPFRKSFPRFNACRSLIGFFPKAAFSNLEPFSPGSVQAKDEDRVSQYDPFRHSLFKSFWVYPYLEDNYGYVVMDQQTKSLIAIDTGSFPESQYAIETIEEEHGAKLTHILTTHWHDDHTGGNSEWKRYRPEVQIISGDTGVKIPGSTERMTDLQTFQLGDLCICCFFTPGHTKGHVSYIVTEVTETSTKTPFLFSGDALFVGGCGRILQGGSVEELYDSLMKLRGLPNETLLFCGHEYTKKNLMFAKTVDPKNDYVEHKFNWASQMVDQGRYTVGSTMMEERMYNPFLRVNEPHFKELTGEDDPVRVLAKLRKFKDLA